MASESTQRLVVEPEQLASIVFLLIGSPGCGKTSFMRRITSGELDASSPDPYHIAGTPYVLRNSAQTNAPELEFYEGEYRDNQDIIMKPDVVVLCYDIGERRSCEALEELNREVAKSYGMDMPTVVLGLKRDLRDSLPEDKIVTPQEGYVLAQKIEVTGYMECSALKGDLIPLVVEDLVKKGLDVKMGVLHGRNAESFMAGCNIQ